MIRAKLAVCGESVVRDADTNAMSVFNIIEDISAPGFPAVIPKLATLFIIERDEDDPDQIESLVVINLNDREIGRLPLISQFEGKFRSRLTFVGEGVIIEELGQLTITLEVNQQPLTSWVISVKTSATSTDESKP